MSHYLSIANYRTRIGRYGRVADWFAHYEEQGRWTLSHHFERTLQECLHWSGYNLPLLHPASLDAYLHHVQANHPIVVDGTTKGHDVDANVSARAGEENSALAGANEGHVVDAMQISSPSSGTAKSTSSPTISATRAAATTLSSFRTAEKATQVQFDDPPSAYAVTAFLEHAPKRFARSGNTFGCTNAPNTEVTKSAEALLESSGVVDKAQLKRTRRMLDCLGLETDGSKVEYYTFRDHPQGALRHAGAESHGSVSDFWTEATLTPDVDCGALGTARTQWFDLAMG
ncbi:MAG: hypothetical protein GY772_21130, partial [bacterium]|nr:hypothetical protein [bacterium]